MPRFKVQIPTWRKRSLQAIVREFLWTGKLWAVISVNIMKSIPVLVSRWKWSMSSSRLGSLSPGFFTSLYLLWTHPVFFVHGEKIARLLLQKSHTFSIISTTSSRYSFLTCAPKRSILTTKNIINNRETNSWSDLKTVQVVCRLPTSCCLKKKSATTSCLVLLEQRLPSRSAALCMSFSCWLESSSR